jgi:hypothetical protein
MKQQACMALFVSSSSTAEAIGKSNLVTVISVEVSSGGGGVCSHFSSIVGWVYRRVSTTESHGESVQGASPYRSSIGTFFTSTRCSQKLRRPLTFAGVILSRCSGVNVDGVGLVIALIGNLQFLKNVVVWDKKKQFVLHRKHITSPLQSPAS